MGGFGGGFKPKTLLWGGGGMDIFLEPDTVARQGEVWGQRGTEQTSVHCTSRRT